MKSNVDILFNLRADKNASGKFTEDEWNTYYTAMCNASLDEWIEVDRLVCELPELARGARRANKLRALGMPDDIDLDFKQEWTSEHREKYMEQIERVEREFGKWVFGDAHDFLQIDYTKSNFEYFVIVKRTNSDEDRWVSKDTIKFKDLAANGIMDTGEPKKIEEALRKESLRIARPHLDEMGIEKPVYVPLNEKDYQVPVHHKGTSDVVVVIKPVGFSEIALADADAVRKFYVGDYVSVSDEYSDFYGLENEHYEILPEYHASFVAENRHEKGSNSNHVRPVRRHVFAENEAQKKS